MTEEVPWIVRIVEERFHRDTEGRPIREGRTPAEFCRPGETLLSQCPYPGSRLCHPNPMNVSALRQTTTHWDAILDALAVLQRGYSDGRGAYGPDLRDVWYVSQLGSALPWFFILRDGACPPYAAALAKATLGTGILAQRAIVKMFSERWPPPSITPSTLMQLSEVSGTLIGATEVCAASEKMIVRFCDVICPDRRPVTAGAICGLAEFADDVLAFGSSYAAFKIVVWIYYLARRFLYADAGLLEQLNEPVQPPDFYLVEPSDLKTVSPALRGAWFRQLADLIMPFGRQDEEFHRYAHRFAATMATGEDPRKTWTTLDQLFGEFATLVESSLTGVQARPIDASFRDRLTNDSARTHLTPP